MKKMLPYMGAAIAALAMTWSAQAKAQDMFKDVPPDHWAYAAIQDLQQKKILLGYPNGYFQGKRVLTRYEFAVALKRALDAIQATPGPKGDKGDPGAAGPAGDVGPKGDIGPPGMTPEQVAELMRLADQFKNELAQLGTDVKAIQSRLDALAKTVAALNEKIDKMPMISGEFFQGFRSDLARFGYIDYGGAFRGASKSPFTAVDAPSDFHLNVKANLNGGVKFVADLFASTYLNYAGGLGKPAGAFGGAAAGNGAPAQVGLYQADLMVPLSQFGTNTMLELGRYKNQLTPLTYMRPDTDPYFSLPWYNDGNYIEDGFKLSTKFGSAVTELFAGSYTNLTSTAGFIQNSSLGNFGTATTTGDFEPANQSAGLHIGLPLMKIGELGFTLIDFSGTPGAASGHYTPDFTNEVVFGVNANLNPIGRLNISAEAAKSVTQANFDHTDGQSNDDNNAFNIHASYKSKGLGVLAGYQYIDPRFSAPGYWDKIGSVYNPVNVQGPYARLSYAFSNKLSGDIGGEYLEGARNRLGLMPPVSIETMGSNIGKMEAGLKYKLNRTVHLSADYEGDFYNPTYGLGLRASAWQQFLTLGAGVNLAGNTVLKFGYQILADQDRAAVTPFTGGLASINANTFYTSVVVHF